MAASYLGKFNGWADTNDSPSVLSYWPFEREFWSLSGSLDSKVPVFLNEPITGAGFASFAGHETANLSFIFDLVHPVGGLVERDAGSYENYSIEDGNALAGFYDWASLSGAVTSSGYSWEAVAVAYDGSTYSSGRLPLSSRFESPKPFAYLHAWVYGPTDGLFRAKMLLGEKRPIYEWQDVVEYRPLTESGQLSLSGTSSTECFFGTCSVSTESGFSIFLRPVLDKASWVVDFLGISKAFDFINFSVPLTPSLSFSGPMVEVLAGKVSVGGQTLTLSPIPQNGTGSIVAGRSISLLGTSSSLETSSDANVLRGLAFGLFGTVVWYLWCSFWLVVLLLPLQVNIKILDHVWKVYSGETVDSSNGRTIWMIPALVSWLLVLVVLSSTLILWSGAVIYFAALFRPVFLALLSFVLVSFGGYGFFAAMVNGFLLALAAMLVPYVVKKLVESYGRT